VQCGRLFGGVTFGGVFCGVHFVFDLAWKILCPKPSGDDVGGVNPPPFVVFF